MFDHFLFISTVIGLMIALCAGPIGCFIIWRKSAYFSDSLGHATLLGFALSAILQISPLISMFLFCFIFVGLLLYLKQGSRLSTDAHLGILSQGSLAIALILIGLFQPQSQMIFSYLFGDILLLTTTDMLLTAIAAIFIIGGLCYLWRPLLRLTLHHDIAYVEGTHPFMFELFFYLITALIVCLGVKILGALLITTLLILPAASAALLAKTPERMAVLSSLMGVMGIVCGIAGSYVFDLPSGPSIVVVLLGFFGVSHIYSSVR